MIGQLAKGFRVSRTSQGRNIKGWFGGWSDGAAVALIRLVGRAREEISRYGLVVGQLAEELIGLTGEEIFRYGLVVGQFAKGFGVSRTSQGRNVKVWVGGWSVWLGPEEMFRLFR